MHSQVISVHVFGSWGGGGAPIVNLPVLYIYTHTQTHKTKGYRKAGSFPIKIHSKVFT